MNKGFIISVILNFCFITMFSFIIFQKGGLNYLKERLAFKTKNSSEKFPAVHTNNNLKWMETKSLYDELPSDSNDIVFIGNSLTYRCNWSEMFANLKIKNRGIEGDNTHGVLDRLTEITESKPKKIFINIGTNDLGLGISISTIINNYRQILNKIKQSTPKTMIYMESVLPTNNNPERNNDTIRLLNDQLKQLANEKSVKYIDLFDSFLDKNGNLNMDLSLDGLHLNGKGYLIWKGLLEYSVNEQQNKVGHF